MTRLPVLRDRAAALVDAGRLWRRLRWARRPPLGRRPGALLLAAVGVLAVVKAVLLVHQLRTPVAPYAPAGDVPPPAILSHEARPDADPLAVEPAAGPDPGAPDVDEPWAGALASRHAAGDAGPPESPGRVLTRPEDLTESDLVILQDLVARRRALDEREGELDLREALLDDAEARLSAQLEELARLKAAIEEAIGQHGADEAAELASLVKIYETMKPKAAAEIFNRLEMAVLLEVVSRMREAKASDVIGRMDPKRAKELTAELARRRELPPLPR